MTGRGDLWECDRCGETMLDDQAEAHVEQCLKDQPNCVICASMMWGGGEIDEWHLDFHFACLSEIVGEQEEEHVEASA